MVTVLCVMLSQLPEAWQVSADPDATVTELGWRSSLRAKIGAAPEFLDLGESPRFRLRLPSFIELHNAPGNTIFVPVQYWRARIQLEGLLRFHLREGLKLRLATRLEHESDHPTASVSNGDEDWLNMNAVAVATGLGWATGANVLDVNLTLRLHVLTCTRDTWVCGQGGGLAGDRGFEASLGASYQRVLWQGKSMLLDTFLSAFGAFTLPTALIVEERRLTGRAGVGLTRTLGRVYLFVESWLGTRGSYQRNQGDVAYFGFGFGWTGGAAD